MEKAGIYIHIPFCRKKCDYCAFVSTDNQTLQSDYLYRLKAEIASSKIEKADTLYVGGGTPSVAHRGFLTKIYSELKAKKAFDELKEFTVECNPESVSFGFLSECRVLGVNRLSMGLQSANDEILKSIGRVHSVSDFCEAVKRARSFGIENISGDLILGLPSQDEQDIEKAIDIFDELGIDHISIYSLSVEEGTPLAKRGYNIDDDYQADLYDFALYKLREKGYERYEVSNFARNGKVAQHNTKYWTGANYYGFGVSAHSLINGKRKENTSSITEYLSGVTVKKEIKLTPTDIHEEFIMLRLRMSKGIDLMEYERNFGRNLLDYRKKEIDKLSALGVIEICSNRLKATDKGFYLLNSIITELL